MTRGALDGANEGSLMYPFDGPPEDGDTCEVAPGLFWLRMPLDGRPDHVNIWLLEECDGWTVIDCGINNDRTHEIWQRHISGMMKDKPVRQIIATHAHVDHIGYVGRLARQTGAPVTMTLAEFLTGTVRVSEPPERMAEQARRMALSCGCPEDVAERMTLRRRKVRESYSGMPLTYRRTIAGQRLRAGRRDWLISTWGGHSPEMLCMFDEQAGILIAGDQVLTQITPSINVHPTEPRGNPLAQYYQSFTGLKAFPDDTLVLPSHGMPFHGLHRRIDQIRDHHEDRLDKILGFVGAGATPYEVALRTFERAMKSSVARQALSETLAHLHFLVQRQLLIESTDAEGTIRFAPSSIGQQNREDMVATSHH